MRHVAGLIPQHDFNTGILQAVAHRPWALPDGPWVMTQTWHDLLFAHWPVEAAAMRARVPERFGLDLFDGRAWLGIVPFHMTNVAPRGLPALPRLSAFPELNVRTYVRVNDKPGVYFFSLDAGSSIAVLAARTMFNLPYYAAWMRLTREAGVLDYSSRRRNGRAEAEWVAQYRPEGPVFIPQPGSLEYFLTERYCLYNLDRRSCPYRLEIHHPPWPLQVARVTIVRNSMAAAAGIGLPPAPPLVHFAKRQDMVGWWPIRLE
jgi:uncharacterized protein YqjF (DUF2071 family)